jgi:hypothetical protein
MNNSMSLVPFRKRSLAVVSRRFYNRVILERVVREMLLDRLPGLLDSFAYRFMEANRATLLAIDSIEIFQMQMNIQRRRTWELRLQDNGFSSWVKE